MPEASTLLTFGLTAAAVVISPGPDTIVILRHALAGRLAGLAAVFGVQLGLIIHTVLAGLGISALIAASPALLKALALAGALYLAWLGFRLLRAESTPFVSAVAARVSARRAAREALLTNLLNPKVLMLFLAIYPNFIAAGQGHLAMQIGCLSVLLIGINLVWQAGLVLTAGRARQWLARPAVGRGTRLCVGTAFTTFALVLAIEHIF